MKTPSGLALALALGLTGAMAEPAAAGTRGCGEDPYVIKRGDSLSAVARRYYRTFEYGPILQANRDVIADPSSIEVGMRLFIPCTDGSGPRTRAEAEAGSQTAQAAEPVAAETPQVAEAPVTAEPVRLITGSGFAPFVSRDLPGGGAVTEIVSLSIAHANPMQPYQIAWNNDWAEHLTDLLPAGTHDVTFPWQKPDCGRPLNLDEVERENCQKLAFSEPVYRVAIGYYVLADGPAADFRSHASMVGRTICRPWTYRTGDMTTVGLAESRVNLVRAPDASGCLRMLDEGTAEIASLSVDIAERELIGRSDVVRLAGLDTEQTLHAVALKSSPRGLSALALIDRGLSDLQDQGLIARTDSAMAF